MDERDELILELRKENDRLEQELAKARQKIRQLNERFATPIFTATPTITSGNSFSVTFTIGEDGKPKKSG